MTEENQDVQSEAPEQSETVTLDDLYSEFEPAQQTQPVQSAPQTQTETQPQASFNNVPDPVTDTDGFTRYMGQHNQELASLRKSLLETKESLEKEKQEMATRKEEEAFNELSSEVGKSAGLDAEDVAPHLLYKFVQDSKFQKIWQNRHNNEKAFNKVKSYLADEMKKKVRVTKDNQAAENDKALSDAINNASSSTHRKSKDEEVASMSDSQFDRWWQSNLS